MKTAWFWLLSTACSFAQLTTYRQVVQLEVANATRQDQAYFLAGETIAGQAHIYQAATHQPDSLDSPLYVDWIDQSQGLLLNRLILKPHLGIASFKLTLPDSLPTGYYQLRAYTNWMRNFSAQAFGQRSVLILNPTTHRTTTALTTSTSSVHTLQVQAEGNTVVAGLHNKLVIFAQDTFGRGLVTHGFVGQDQSDTLTTFQTDTMGFTSLELMPQPNHTYWIQTGSLRKPLPAIKPMGSVLRCDDVTNSDRIRITIENQYPSAKDSLTLVAQNRGHLIIYNRIAKQTPVTVLYLARNALPPGLLNLSLVDSQQGVLNERMVYQAPAADSLSATVADWLNAELDVPIYLRQARHISQALVFRHNTLFSGQELMQPRRYSFSAESGIRVAGQVAKWNGKSVTGPVTVSLLAVPLREDSLHQRHLFFTSTDTTGRFRFDNLAVYGPYHGLLTAKIGNLSAQIRLDTLIIPPIKAQPLPIDWASVGREVPSPLLQARYASLQQQRHRRQQEQGITLQAVTVKAHPLLARRQAFINPPTVSLNRQKVISGGFDNLEIVLSREFVPRLKAYGFHPRYAVFVDNIQLGPGVEPPSPGVIDHINVHDGDEDAKHYGVDIILSIYTTFFTGLQANSSSGKLFELTGYQPAVAGKQ